MGIPVSQYREMQARVGQKPTAPPQPIEISAARLATMERDIHDQIMDYCDSQRPRWKLIHSRMDKPSTIQVGAPDFPVIYLPGGRMVVVEVKMPGGKMDIEQDKFKAELLKLGHFVHVVTSLNEFMGVVGGVFNP